MILYLTAGQKVSLLALLNSMPYGIGDVRLVWALQDKLAVSEAEAREIDLTVSYANGGMPLFSCDLLKPTEAMAVELTEIEERIFRDALAEKKVSPATRPWLEPLLNQLI